MTRAFWTLTLAGFLFFLAWWFAAGQYQHGFKAGQAHGHIVADELEVGLRRVEQHALRANAHIARLPALPAAAAEHLEQLEHLAAHFEDHEEQRRVADLFDPAGGKPWSLYDPKLLSPVWLPTAANAQRLEELEGVELLDDAERLEAYFGLGLLAFTLEAHAAREIDARERGEHGRELWEVVSPVVRWLDQQGLAQDPDFWASVDEVSRRCASGDLGLEDLSAARCLELVRARQDQVWDELVVPDTEPEAVADGSDS